MNDSTRDEINYILKNFSSDTVNLFLEKLKNKSITLESKSFDLIDEGISSSDVKHFELLLDEKKFESAGEIIILFELLKEIKDLRRNVSTSTKLVCTRPDISAKDTDETDLVMTELVGSAKESITIIGYLMMPDKDIKRIFEMIKNNPNIMKLKIKFIFDNVDKQQKLGKMYPSVKEIIRGLWSENVPFPEIYTYSRKSDSLHAKVIIIDSKEILATSANMSSRAIERNFEVGIRHKGKPAEDAEKIVRELIDKQWFIKK